MGPAGYVAMLAGWITEVGRQPWVVYGIMRTKTAFTYRVGRSGGSKSLYFVVVYTIVLVAVFYT